MLVHPGIEATNHIGNDWEGEKFGRFRASYSLVLINGGGLQSKQRRLKELGVYLNCRRIFFFGSGGWQSWFPVSQKCSSRTEDLACMLNLGMVHHEVIKAT